MHHPTRFSVAIFALLLVALNFWCWLPGMGSARTEFQGTELELYYGWPVIYQAEWWRSEDPNLGDRLLNSMPFYSYRREMKLQDRYFGSLAALADLAFAGAALTAIAIFTEAAVRQRPLSRRTWQLLVAAAIVMAILLAASANLSQHL